METMREGWTDARLDDLSRRMDRGFDRVEADLRALDARLGGGLDSVQGRIDALQRTMLQVGVGLIAALVGVMATVVGLAIAHI